MCARERTPEDRSTAIPAHKPTDLSVVVVSFNTRDLTLKCLGNLQAELDQSDVPAEVWVVDNASADGSAAAVRAAFPEMKIVENDRNRGFGAANNQAIREAAGEFLLLINSDAFPLPGAITKLIEFMKAHPQCAVLGPRLLNADRTLQPSCYRLPTPFRAVCEHLLLTAAFPNHSIIGDYRAWPHDQIRDVEMVIGACMLVRRLAVDQVGMFDENFFLYAEEADLCNRFSDAGWKVTFLPNAEVIHLGGESGKPQAQRVFAEFRRASERYVKKHHGLSGLWLFRFMLLVGSCVRIVAFGAAAVVQPRQRCVRMRRVAEWSRILRWSLGIRGPGLLR